MISKKMVEAITKQINAELYSSYLYMSMGYYASHINFKGAANWFFVQAQEEQTHATRFAKYLDSLGEHVTLAAIAQPPTTFRSLLDMFEETLKHEKKVTALINALADLAGKEGDHASSIMLQWFITEQIEEEQNATEIIATLKMIGDKGAGLIMLDKQLGSRKAGG
jgi:ferritin